MDFINRLARPFGVQELVGGQQDDFAAYASRKEGSPLK
jgi:hypothetical protein